MDNKTERSIWVKVLWHNPHKQQTFQTVAETGHDVITAMKERFDDIGDRTVRLIFAGKLMPPETSLASWNIVEGTAIHAVVTDE